MNENNKIIPDTISDQQMEEIVGGISADRIPQIKTKNSSRYSSGETPKYSVGQRLAIECYYMGHNLKLPCIVLSVSETATGGSFCKEFVYSIEMDVLDVEPYKVFQGMVCQNVFESCLYEI